ncbi:hypothetical protein GCM10029964_071560 [Kibdelosporangium lantanae]
MTRLRRVAMTVAGVAALTLLSVQAAQAATTYKVKNSAELKTALASVKPGDTITLADGSYADQFIATRAGSASAPITLTGGEGAVLSDPLFKPADTDCPSGQTGYGLWLQGANYWNLKGFSVTKSKKGLVLDGASHVTIDGVSVHDIGYEGVHFRKSSPYGVIKNSKVYNTGLEVPGYGEGVYVGSANSNWDCYGNTGGMDASNFVQVLDNKIGPNVAAEGLDIKEGTHDGLVSGNTFDGTGEKNEHDADSTIDAKGNNYTITDNVAKNAYLDVFQVHNVYSGYGCGNIFSKNTLTVKNKNGYGINVTSQSSCSSNPNKVGASNKSTGGKGLTKIPVTPNL